MRGEEVVKLLIKWLCKSADGGGFTKWWIPQQYFCYIKIQLIYSMPEVLVVKCAIRNDLKFWRTATLKLFQSPSLSRYWSLLINWGGQGIAHESNETAVMW